MSKNLTQQRDIYETVIFRFLQIYIYIHIYNRLTTFTVDDLLDAYMIFFQGN